jgi:glycerophosphoryl diester phosphodiesterase
MCCYTDMLLVAHRGLTKNARENSLEAFEAVVLANKLSLPIGVEFDVRVTADGTLVVVHDPECGGFIVDQTTYAQLQTHLGRSCPPTLAEVLSVLAVDLPVMDVELKVTEAVKPALALLADIPRSRLLVSSFLPEAVEQVLHHDPSIRTGLLIDNEQPQWLGNPESMVAAALEVGARTLIPHFSLIDADLIELAGLEQIDLGTYTVNDHQLIASLSESLAWICTDIAEYEVGETPYGTYVRPAAKMDEPLWDSGGVVGSLDGDRNVQLGVH